MVELEPDDVQYWDVSDQLQASMGDAWISRVWRVQNKALWNFFTFHKGRLTLGCVVQKVYKERNAHWEVPPMRLHLWTERKQVGGGRVQTHKG